VGLGCQSSSNRKASEKDVFSSFFAERRAAQIGSQVIEWTGNEGQPPEMGWRNACLVSVADGLFDRKIERFEGLCPVVEAPFALLATSSTEGGAALTSG
jgi:hypothetical protein